MFRKVPKPHAATRREGRAAGIIRRSLLGASRAGTLVRFQVQPACYQFGYGRQLLTSANARTN